MNSHVLPGEGPQPSIAKKPLNSTHCIHSMLHHSGTCSVCSEMAEFPWKSWSRNTWRQVGQSHGQYNPAPKHSHLPYLLIDINATTQDKTLEIVINHLGNMEVTNVVALVPEIMNINRHVNKTKLIDSQLPKVGMLALCLHPTLATTSSHLQVESLLLQLAKQLCCSLLS